MYLHRQSESKFLELNQSFKAILVTGARQVGKTTMLQHLTDKSRAYVSLDDADNLQLAKEDPSLFFTRYKPPVFIDEVQKAPELLPYIKTMCDNSDEKGLFWLTVSEPYREMKNITESLADRVGVMTLYPLSFNEKNGVSFAAPLDFSLNHLLMRAMQAKPFDLQSVFDFIWRGGMPAVQAADDEARDAYFSSYVDSLVRDAKTAAGVSDEKRFRKFLAACAVNVSRLLNMNKLAETAGITPPTAKHWLYILERQHIIFLLPAYENDNITRLIKAPKLYFIDTGLCAYLANHLTKESLTEGEDAEYYFENFVISELIKESHYASLGYHFSYFRNSNYKEVDLFLEADGIIHPLEIKLSADPDKRVVRKYTMLDRKAVPRGDGGIICMSPTVVSIDRKNSLIPVNLL